MVVPLWATDRSIDLLPLCLSETGSSKLPGLEVACNGVGSWFIG